MNHFLRQTLILGSIGAALILGAVLDSFYLFLLTQIYVFALLALSVDLLIGFLGLVPLGHAGIFGSSAYVLAYGLTRTDLSFFSAVILSLGAGCLISLLFGVLAVRTRGIYFIMLTLAEGMIVWGIVQRWTTVTGGANGIRGIPRPSWTQADLVFNYLALAVLVISFWLISKLVSSSFGLALKGIKQRESRMGPLGYNVFLVKTLGFFTSGSIASVAGILFTLHHGFISPSSVDFVTSAESVLMVILGGTGTLWGALVGSFLVIGTKNIVSLFTNRWTLIMGLMYVITILLSREGILGVLKTISGEDNNS